MKTLALPLLVAALLATAAPLLACGTTAVCNDTGNSLTGQVISESIVITWTTDNEDSTVAGYKVKRYNCGDPTQCSVLVANVPKVSSCSTSHTYEVDDTPPSPISQWIYSVEVWSAGNRACAEDVTPQ